MGLRHTVAVLVQNSPGVLTRVAGLFSRRGFNIESVAVGVTDHPDVSRMTIVVEGDSKVLEQVEKQLNKLINVLKVTDLQGDESVSRELALIKVNAEPARRAQILQIVDIFRAKVIDVGKRSLIVEITGDAEKIDALIQLMGEFGIREVVRTGRIAMERGTRIVKIEKESEEDDQNVLRQRR